MAVLPEADCVVLLELAQVKLFTFPPCVDYPVSKNLESYNHSDWKRPLSPGPLVQPLVHTL